MSVLVFAESHQGKLKKGSSELCSYGFALAQQQNISLTIVTINCEEANQLSEYGASKLINLNMNNINLKILLQYSQIILNLF